MKRSNQKFKLKCWCLGFFAAVAALMPDSGAWAVDQIIGLQPGWNSIFLEVRPENQAPEVIFSGQPVEMCAAWLPTAAKVDSLTAADAVPTKSAEWRIWQPSASPSAFLNNLRALTGRQALLIKASAAATVTVSGTPVFERRKWNSPSFNFTGFDVDATAPPTFARFFDGSRAHAGLKAFKLVSGKWQAVSGTETIQRGRAYWVWCNEGSDFQGPVDVSLPLAGEGVLTLANGAGAARLEARSNGTLPVTLSLGLTGSLPLLQSVSGADEAAFAAPVALPLTAASKSVALRRVLDAAPDSATGLLSLKGGGMNFLLPVRGSR